MATVASSSASSSTHVYHASAPASSAQAAPAAADWTKDLVRLAKTAELRRNALTLQMHTSHILSAHAGLDQRKLALEDLREQKNKLDSERTRLLEALRQVNEDRDQADMLDMKMNKECTELQAKIQTLTDGDYAKAKAEVDVLRTELGQQPVPSLQSLIEEKSAQYLEELRLVGEKRRAEVAPPASAVSTTRDESMPPPTKKRRGRPPGCKNLKTRAREAAAAAEAESRGAMSVDPPERASTPSEADA